MGEVGAKHPEEVLVSKKQVTIEEKMNRDLIAEEEKDLIRLVNSAPSPKGKA